MFEVDIFDTTESGFAVGNSSSYSLVCFKLRGLSTGKATDAELFTSCDNFKYQWSSDCHFLFVSVSNLKNKTAFFSV